ncbi:unnamed protein product [Owenia fusiformis]|uniref:Uncharacterized protein n=1 Tax=Owenia fusiformis TaxID=6347 RepID=A0A8J1XU15_OWEFU|nr:unnamed protein product [Owenia fusiformis]
MACAIHHLKWRRNILIGQFFEKKVKFNVCNCAKCGERQKIYFRDECVDCFCTWLFTPNHEGYLTIAHNFRKETAYCHYKPPQVLRQGSRIIVLKDPSTGVEFRDTLNYIQLKLADFPKCFGLQAKGEFPHLSHIARNKIRTTMKENCHL